MTTDWGGALVPQSTGRSQALTTRPIGNSPEERRFFAKTLAPCLTLTAPVGMTESDRRDWYAAAYRALAHLPADLIERGAREALKVADHPSKIVPAIIAAAEPDLRWRQRNARLGEPAPALPPPGPADEKERAEVRDLMNQLAAKMKEGANL